MVRKIAAMGSMILVFAAGSAAAGSEASPTAQITQIAAPAAGPSAPSFLSAAPSNVCVTPYGVCLVVPGTTRGAPCQCFLPPATLPVAGVAEYWVRPAPSETP